MKMCILKLFKKDKKTAPVGRAIPSWEEAVRLMQGRQLDFTDEVVKVIPSRDLSRRLVLLRSGKGYYKFCSEMLVPYDDEYKSFGTYEHPGVYWLEAERSFLSIYADEETALREIGSTPEYKEYFA